jgi:endonuclease-3 related protein
MTTTQDLLDVYGALEAMHAWRGWHWWPDADPFEVVVGCILVQNTSWTNVERAIENLRSADRLNFAAMADLGADDLETLIRPSGQYRQKAKKLRAFLDLAEGHGGFKALLSTPADELRPLLLATFGIGPETADAIICYAARQPAFAMDAYTARLFTRLGIVPGGRVVPGYADWQDFFVSRLPADRDLWARYHALIVMQCKHTCRKLKPRCGECQLAQRCTYPGTAQ